MRLCWDNRLYIFALLSLIFVCYLDATSKQKILILTSKGGGGHTSATQAIKQYLGNGYDIIPVNALTEILGTLDPLYAASANYINGEDVVNIGAQHNWYRLLNKIARIGTIVMRHLLPKMEKLFLCYFKQQKPDLIISVMPMINGAALAAAKQLSIPYMIVMPDIDPRLYEKNLNQSLLNYDKATFCVPYVAPLKGKIISKFLEKNKLIATGFPLRTAFFEPKDTKKIKQQFKIPHNKPVILLLMGGAGSHKAYWYVRTLLQSPLSLHIIVCCGRNEQLRKKIKRLHIPSAMSVTALSFTDKIADLMAVSDILITKSGPNSICEALQMNLPMLVDATEDLLDWEKFNIEFVKQYNLGSVIHNYQHVLPLVHRILTDKNYYNSIQKSMQHFDKGNFGQTVRNLVQRLIRADMKNISASFDTIPSGSLRTSGNI